MLQKIIKPENCIFAIGIPTSRNNFDQDLFTENKDFVKIHAGGRRNQPEEVWKKYENDIVKVLDNVIPVIQKAGCRFQRNLTFEKFKELVNTSENEVIILFTHWKNNPNHTVFTRHRYINFLEAHPDFLEHITHSSETLKWLLGAISHSRSLLNQKLQQQEQEGNTPLVELKNDFVLVDYDNIVYHHIKKLAPDTFLELLKNTHSSEVEFHDGLKDLYEIVTVIPQDFDRMICLDICSAYDLAVALKKLRPSCHLNFKHDIPAEGFNPGVIPRFMLFFYMALFIHLSQKSSTYLQAFKDISFEFLEEEKKKGGHIERIKRYFHRLSY